MSTVEDRVGSLERWRRDVHHEFRELEDWRKKMAPTMEELDRWYKENIDWLEVLKSDVIYRQRKAAEEKSTNKARIVVLGLLVSGWVALITTLQVLTALYHVRGR